MDSEHFKKFRALMRFILNVAHPIKQLFHYSLKINIKIWNPKISQGTTSTTKTKHFHAL